MSGSAEEEVGFSGIKNGKVRRRNTGVAGGAEKKLHNHDKSINIFLKPFIWLGVFDNVGRAKRGVSGTLYSQSAIARLNSFPRVD